MTLSLLFIITISFLSLLAYYRAKRPRLNLPPGPTPWPVLGNLYQLKPLLFRCFHEWAQIFGPIMSVWYGSNLNIVVSSSELAKEVLKDCDQELANRYRIKSQVKFTKNGMDLTWADYGPHYVTVRKVCTSELFSNKKIEASRPLREYEVSGVIESIYKDCKGFIGENHREGMITLRKYMAKAALNHVTRLTFGKSFFNPEGNMDEQGQEFMDILHEVRTIKRLNMLVEYVPWLQWIFPPYDQAFDKHVDRLTRFAKEIMEEDNNRHFVQALVSSNDKYDLGQDTIVGLLWDLIIAGMDTVAIAVEWAMAELVRNPRVQQKAQEELDNVIGQKRTMTEEDIQNLPYLQATVKEALRLHPPTPLMLPHRANADVKIGGYDVPKGTTVIVNVWAIARDPNIWPDPDAFCPERFLNEDIDVKGHDFRLLPFGTGRRVCPGAQLGLNLVTLMLGRLLHHFNWISSNSVDCEEIDMSESPGIVTYMATPLQVVPLPRLNFTSMWFCRPR